MATRSTPAAANAAPSYTGPFITVAILFGIFGFLTSLNNTLVAKLEASSICRTGRRSWPRRPGFLPTWSSASLPPR